MKTDLAIIGAGPAGMSAARVASDHGLSVTVLDEQAAPGGQIYRQPPAEFAVGNALAGRAYQAGREMVRAAADDDRVDWRFNTSVCGILRQHGAEDDSRFRILLDRAGACSELVARQVLVAPGCYDMPVVFRGWNLPGVMAAGGIQAFIKGQQFVAGERIVFSGSHPLQLIVADQLVQAGGKVGGVYFAQRPVRALAPLLRPAATLPHLGKLFQAAAAWGRLKAAGVPVKFGHTVVEAAGTDRLEQVRIAPIGGDGEVRRDRAQAIDCDRLGICFGFLVNSELVRQVGADCAWSDRRGGWIARHDEWMQTTVPGMFVAGEITGMAGGEVAAEEGGLAALGCALDAGRIDRDRAAGQAGAYRQRLRRANHFARMLCDLAWPGSALFEQLQADDANLCKCEEVTVGAFRGMLDEHPHVTTASAAKLLSRAGMGYCQGRYCHFALTRTLAVSRGIPAEQVGRFTARFPARPVPVAHVVNRQD